MVPETKECRCESEDQNLLPSGRPTIGLCVVAQGQSLGCGPEYCRVSPMRSSLNAAILGKAGRVNRKPSGRFWSALESWHKKPAVVGLH